MVLKIQEFRFNEFRHGKASSIAPSIQKVFKTCWFPSPSSINDKIKAKFPKTSVPADDTTIPQPWNILRRIPRHLSSSFILRVRKMILTQKASKVSSNATSPPHPIPDPNVFSGELLLPEAAGKSHNSLRKKKKNHPIVLESIATSSWVWKKTLVLSKLAPNREI